MYQPIYPESNRFAHFRRPNVVQLPSSPHQDRGSKSRPPYTPPTTSASVLRSASGAILLKTLTRGTASLCSKPSLAPGVLGIKPELRGLLAISGTPNLLPLPELHDRAFSSGST